MKKLLLGSLSLASLLALSGCGGDVKSVDELKQLSKDELRQMNKACEAVISPETSKLGDNTSDSDIIKADESDSKLKKEREKIANDILQARGEEPKKFGLLGSSLYMVVADFTNEEVSKFGNSDFAEYVQCARVTKALKN